MWRGCTLSTVLTMSWISASLGFWPAGGVLAVRCQNNIGKMEILENLSDVMPTYGPHNLAHLCTVDNAICIIVKSINININVNFNDDISLIHSHRIVCRHFGLNLNFLRILNFLPLTAPWLLVIDSATQYLIHTSSTLLRFKSSNGIFAKKCLTNHEANTCVALPNFPSGITIRWSRIYEYGWMRWIHVNWSNVNWTPQHHVAEPGYLLSGHRYTLLYDEPSFWVNPNFLGLVTTYLLKASW
jgi:hypothetical protein